MKVAVDQLDGLHVASGRERRRTVCLAAGLFVAALVMGWPSLSGGFLSGDDIQLARDHVLVNHPSLDHVVDLFSIIHRDLYQPLALLSFSADFVLANALGLREEMSVAGVFHATNVLLHALNTLLVFSLLRKFRATDVTSFVAASLFALHPLNVEPVAWISGRMMLLSTLFLLVALVEMDTWRVRGGWWRATLVVVLVACCMMSKVRIALPVLLLVSPLVRWEKPKTRWWGLWAMCAVVTVCFVGLNVYASSGLIARGSETLQGSRIVRTVLALAWYLTHVVVPVGLSPFHPAIKDASWSEPGLLISGAVLLVAAVAAVGVVISARRTRVVWCGGLWFLAAIAVTLPLIPTRNLSVAERYTYLPHIGLYWIVASLVVHVAGWLRLRFGVLLGGRFASVVAGATAGVIGMALAVGLCGLSWANIRNYRDDITRASRIAAVYPDQPEIGVRYADALRQAGKYEEALRTAAPYARSDDGKIRSSAYQAIGLTLYRQGEVVKALAALEKAAKADPSDGRIHAQRARVLESTGDIEGAITALKRCAALLPNYNPALIRLGTLQLQTRRDAEAQPVFELAVRNNPYEALAILGLAQIEINQERYADALDRLQALLRWMPENVPARINAGVCLEHLGRREEARRAYERALAIDPDARLATLNLTGLLRKMNLFAEAGARIETYLQRHPTDRDALEAACANALAAGKPAMAAALLTTAIEHEPAAADLRGRYAWLSCVAKQWDSARQQAGEALRLDAGEPWARIAQVVIRLHEGHVEQGISEATRLRDDGSFGRPGLFDAMASALQVVAEDRVDDPWPYGILAMACRATQRVEAATMAVGEFKKRTVDRASLDRLALLLGGTASQPSGG